MLSIEMNRIFSNMWCELNRCPRIILNLKNTAVRTGAVNRTWVVFWASVKTFKSWYVMAQSSKRGRRLWPAGQPELLLSSWKSAPRLPLRSLGNPSFRGVMARFESSPLLTVNTVNNLASLLSDLKYSPRSVPAYLRRPHPRIQPTTGRVEPSMRTRGYGEPTALAPFYRPEVSIREVLCLPGVLEPISRGYGGTTVFPWKECVCERGVFRESERECHVFLPLEKWDCITVLF